MVEQGKSRVIIISHPRYNEGVDGIQDAKEFGEGILAFVANFKEQIQNDPDLTPEEKAAEIEETQKYKVYVRKVPNELL
jgi:hypothetical protein